MPTRFLLLLALVVALVFDAPTAHADPLHISATLSYSINEGWFFDTGSVFGRVLSDQKMSKKLARLYKYTAHVCFISFDPESKVVATNGTFYTVLSISRCN
jgi:hypothetical protein